MLKNDPRNKPRKHASKRKVKFLALVFFFLYCMYLFQIVTKPELAQGDWRGTGNPCTWQLSSVCIYHPAQLYNCTSTESVRVLFKEVYKFLCRITFCDHAIKVHQLKGIISRKGIRRFMAMLPSLPFASTWCTGLNQSVFTAASHASETKVHFLSGLTHFDF